MIAAVCFSCRSLLTPDGCFLFLVRSPPAIMAAYLLSHFGSPGYPAVLPLYIPYLPYSIR